MHGLLFVLRLIRYNAAFLNGTSQEHRERSSMPTRKVMPLESVSERVLKHPRRQLIGEFKQLLTEHTEGTIE
jgi:hypothetical protein